MMLHSLGRRERALSLWVQDRLHERAAIEWATKALKRIQGPLSAELVNLFSFLEEHARESDRLGTNFKTVWHLFRVVAQENSSTDGSRDSSHLREELRARKTGHEFAARLVDLVRPRLRADPPWKLDEPSKEENPIRWVRWEFKNRAGPLNRFEGRFSQADLRNLAEATLVRIIERGTDALKDALAHAEHIGWFDNGADIVTYYVHRVVAPEELADLVEEGSEDAEERDPDAYNDNFAPLVRLLTTAFGCLRERSPDAARGVCMRWDSDKRGLLLRLAAFARWDPEVKSGNEVGAFLLPLPERPFWVWNHYPEIATARALRWNDLNTDAQNRLEQRLVAGPPPIVFGEGDRREGLADYYRDHELARLVDNQATVSAGVRATVEARRVEDNEFPRHVPMIEPGRESIRVVKREPGDPRSFDNVPVEHLLEHLQKAAKEHDFGRGDDTEAFASTLSGKAKILAALERTGACDELANIGWRLLLSYPPRKPDDREGLREHVERTTALALQLPLEKVSALSDRLSYWLDAADETVPDFAGASDLWLRLLPHAAERARALEPATTNRGGEKTVDLTTAALNEPLGHLLSMFLRKCPSGSPETPPQLPALYTDPLKKLTGRARELLANRMALVMRYFSFADSEWLDTLVVEPMLSDRPEGDRVWRRSYYMGKSHHRKSGSALKLLHTVAWQAVGSRRRGGGV